MFCGNRATSKKEEAIKQAHSPSRTVFVLGRPPEPLLPELSVFLCRPGFGGVVIVVAAAAHAAVGRHRRGGGHAVHLKIF